MAHDDLHAEHEALKRQFETLWPEHEALEREPYDEARHAEHLRNLAARKAELRAHREV